jgi:ABC-2 type transport system permease protein
VTALIGVIFVPFVVGILVFILTMTTSQYLMQGLVEEKENRMMEVFMTSTRPTEMLWGKLLGLGALGLTLIGAWAVFYAVLGTLSGSVDVGQIIANLQITPGYLALTLAYALLGYLIIAAIMAAIGATSNTEQESRQISSVIGLLGGAPFVLAFAFFTDPNGGLATFLSIFPFTAATSMLFRAGLTSVPPEQIALSLGLMVVTVAGVVWLAGRIFRLGMLSYGKRPRLGEIWRALREGRREIASTGKAKGTGAEVGA